MTEEIIIDGVNVTGCNEFLEPNGCDNTNCVSFQCDRNPNCGFKQLKRLEQENKELKEKLERQKDYIVSYKNYKYDTDQKYRSALEEIKEMILYCEDEYNCNRCKYHDNCLIDDDKFPDFSKALVNKINEVLK